MQLLANAAAPTFVSILMLSIISHAEPCSQADSLPAQVHIRKGVMSIGLCACPPAASQVHDILAASVVDQAHEGLWEDRSADHQS